MGGASTVEVPHAVIAARNSPYRRIVATDAGTLSQSFGFAPTSGRSARPTVPVERGNELHGCDLSGVPKVVQRFANEVEEVLERAPRIEKTDSGWFLVVETSKVWASQRFVFHAGKWRFATRALMVDGQWREPVQELEELLPLLDSGDSSHPLHTITEPTSVEAAPEPVRAVWQMLPEAGQSALGRDEDGRWVIAVDVSVDTHLRILLPATDQSSGAVDIQLVVDGVEHGGDFTLESALDLLRAGASGPTAPSSKSTGSVRDAALPARNNAVETRRATVRRI